MILAVPVGSDHERERLPVLTACLIALCAAAFAVSASMGSAGEAALIGRFGYVPEKASVLRMLAHLFLHGNLVHLLGNMIFLWAFAPDIEDAWGRWRFLALYLGSGFAAILSHHAWVAWTEPQAAGEAAIGASGALSGLIGFYAFRFFRFRLRIWYLLFLGVFARTGVGRVNSVFFIALWFLVQAAFGAVSTKVDAVEVAYWAHVGGFLFGAATAVATRQPRFGKVEFLRVEGQAQFRRGNWWRALDLFQRLGKADPSSARALLEQARCWELLRRPDRAREGFAAAMRLLLARGEDAAAADAYLECAAAFPEAPAPALEERDLRTLLAECERRGEAARAAPLYEALMSG